MDVQSVSRRSFLAGLGSLVVATASLPALAEAKGGAANAGNKKAVIIYFSCTGTTAGVAKRIKKLTGAKMIKVKAEQPYTEDDIDYDAGRSRVSIEHKSASSPAKSSVRPGIANMRKIKKAVKKADTVYIGYPIWWGEAPHIMYTLVEAVSLKGKTVVPFCTSGSSGLGSSAVHLKGNAIVSSKTVWKNGKNYYDVPSLKKVRKWLAKL